MSANNETRRETIISLSEQLVRAWKARYPFGGEPERIAGENRQNGLIYRVLDNLDLPLLRELRVNRYSDQRFGDFVTGLYQKCDCPMVKLGPKIVTYAMDTTDRIEDLCRAFGYKGEFELDWKVQTDCHNALLYLTRVWGDNLKYNVQYLFCYYAQVDLPPRSEKIVAQDGWLCFGKPGRTIRRRLVGDKLRTWECRNTLLQGFKKCLLPLEFEDWYDTVDGTRKSLAGESPVMSPEVREELVRTGRELRRKTPELHVRKNYKLSNSSCIESTRKRGGFCGEYFRRMSLRSEDDDLGIIYRISPPFLVGDYREKGRWEGGLVYSRCELTYVDMFTENRGNTFESLQGEVARVKVRVIPEPFKFRVISIGEFDAYSCLKPYQNMMWKTLQRFDCFSLTGPGNDDLFEKVQAMVGRYWDVGMKFLSGDYKNATNFLSAEASRVLTQEWIGWDHPELMMILERSLFKSKLDFTDAGKGVTTVLDEEIVNTFEESDMTNGQLMGHPCSFPILCAVNAALCRMALEKAWGRSFSLDDLPLLINGDDCLLIGSAELQREWRSRTAEVGLIESVGKSYFTDRFAMINSRLLLVKTHRVGDCVPERYVAEVTNDVGFANLGILVGRKKGNHVDCEVNMSQKVTNDSAYKFWMSAADNFEQMNKRLEKLHVPLTEYVGHFRQYFYEVPLPLHLEKEYGGYGLPVEKVGWGFCQFSGKKQTMLYPKPVSFTPRRDSAVMLGEAYYCGGMASQFDDMVSPDFLEEVIRRCNDIWNGVVEGEIPTCPPEPKAQKDWIVTTL